MRRSSLGFLGGLLGGGALVGWLAWRDSRRWRLRAAQLEQTLAQQGQDAALALITGGEKLQRELALEGQRLAQAGAQEEAERVLALQYGLDMSLLADLRPLSYRLRGGS